MSLPHIHPRVQNQQYPPPQFPRLITSVVKALTQKKKKNYYKNTKSNLIHEN